MAKVTAKARTRNGSHKGGTDAARSAHAGRKFRNTYDAAASQEKRKNPSSILRSEDRELATTDRKKVTNGTRDLRRNFPDAAWAIRKHLDFTATFTFQARTGDDGLDEIIENHIEEMSKPYNCDVAGRHPLYRQVRIAEACRTVDGDVFWLKLPDGRIQAIEGDRVQTASKLPAGYKTDDFTHGILTNKAGRAMEYCVCKRGKGGSGFEFDRIFPAKWIISHGYYDRYDQIRGVTPLASALNAFRDVYEGRAYALAKSKVAQLFGLAIYREASQQFGPLTNNEDADGDGTPDAGGYQVDFTKGPQLLDLEPGDRAEFLENRTPSTEFQQFDQAIIASALKSLDIPFSFYDEGHTNFFGSKGALQQYLFSANIKRADVKNLLDQWIIWQLALAVMNDVIKLPRTIEFSQLNWEWVPAGLPWWKPLEEVKADVEAIANGLTSTPRACKSRGEDDYEISSEEAKYQMFVAKLQEQVKAAGGYMPNGTPKKSASGDESKSTEAEALAKEMNGEKANV